MKGGSRPARRVDAYLFAKTWFLFLERGRELDAHELADILEISIRTSWLWLRTLHQMRCIHIVRWRADSLGREQTPIYAGGDGFDTPKRVRTPEDRRRDRRRKYLEKKIRLEKK